MNQKTSSHWLRLCTLGFSLFVASTTLAAPPNDHPTARDLRDQGIALYQKGQILQAQDVLLRIDLTQLDRAERGDVLKVMDSIKRQLDQMPEPELRLRKAELAMKSADYRTAAQHLDAIVKSGTATAEQKSQAQDMLKQVKTAQDQMLPKVPMILQKAKQDFDSGNFGDAKTGFLNVYNSGVTLDLDQQTELTSYIRQIVTLEATRGSFGAPPAMAAVVQEPPPDNQPAPKTPPPPANPDQKNDQPGATPPTDQNTATPPANETAAPPVTPPTTTGQPNSTLIEQAMKAQAQQFLMQAQDAEASGKYSAARELYNRVLIIQPDNDTAKQGMARCETLINVPPLGQQVPGSDQLKHDQLVAEYNNFMSKAQDELAKAQFGPAYDFATQALIRVGQGTNLLTQAEAGAMKTRATDLQNQINDAKEKARAAEIQQQGQEILTRQKAEENAAKAKRENDIAQKLIAIRRLQLAQRYDEALLECKNLLFIDPGNPTGLILRDTMQELILYRQYDQIKADYDLRASGEFIHSMDKLRIPKDIVEYPPDWPQISLRRSNEFAFNDTEEDRQVLGALASTHVPIDFNSVSFANVMQYIGDIAKVNVDVDWKSLEQNGIDASTPINLKLNDHVNMQVVLDRVLNQLGAGNGNRPEYAVQNGILTVSTREKLQENPIEHIYDIRDLLVDVPNFTDYPTFDLDKILDRSKKRDAIDATKLFGEEESGNYDRTQQIKQQKIDQLRNILTQVIDPKSWEINGGDVGTIEEYNSNFIIRTTARNQRDISNLLSKLREIRSIQINVESRFLAVNQDFFEQFGIDLDLYFGGGAYNRGAQLDPNLLPRDLFVDPYSGNIQSTYQRRFSSAFNDFVDGPGFQRPLTPPQIPPAGLQDAGRSLWSPSSAQNNTLTLANTIFNPAAESMASSIAGLAPGLSYGVTFLDEIQVDLLIEATQADRRNISLSAPSLTFFNGQRAFTQLTTSRLFVSNLTPVVGTASAGLQPTLSPVNEGLVLDVEGVVSADRRYVTMTVNASQSSILSIQSYSIPIVVGGQVLNSSEPNPIITATGNIQAPITQISRVNTTVNVPDRGTILLGGQTIRNDIEVETGVPILSKIPIINRFFTNRIDSTEEKTLMILIKPTIVINQENEELLFPGLEDTLKNSGGGFSNSF